MNEKRFDDCANEGKFAAITKQTHHNIHYKSHKYELLVLTMIVSLYLLSNVIQININSQFVQSHHSLIIQQYCYLCSVFRTYIYKCVCVYICIYIYTGCPLKKVGAVVGSMEELRRTKKSYTILPISQ